MEALESCAGRRIILRSNCLAALVVCTIAITATGCISFKTGRDARYHIVIGFGIVRVSDPDTTALVATSAHSLGVTISDRPDLRFSAGYASSTVVTIPDGAEDVRAEISQSPLGPFVVDVQCATLGSGDSTGLDPQGGDHDRSRLGCD